MVRMSMNQLSTFSWSFEQDLAAYVKWGYQAVGIWRSKLSDVGERHGMELLKDSGLNVSNLMWAGGFTGSDGRSFRDSLHDAIEAIHLASELDAACLVVYTGTRSGHTYNHARRLCRRALEQLAVVADEFGVTLAVQPVHPDIGGEWSLLSGLDDTLQMIDGLPRETVKIAFDTYHLCQSDVDFAKFESIGARVAVIHLADARRPPNGELNCCLLREGVLPIASTINALCDGGFDGYCDVKLLGEDLEDHAYETILEHSRDALDELMTV